MTRVRSSREPRSTSSPAGRERPRRARARLELGEVAAPPQVAPARGRVGAQRGRRKVVRVHEHVHQRVQEHAVPGCARTRTCGPFAARLWTVAGCRKSVARPPGQGTRPRSRAGMCACKRTRALPQLFRGGHASLLAQHVAPCTWRAVHGAACLHTRTAPASAAAALVPGGAAHHRRRAPRARWPTKCRRWTRGGRRAGRTPGSRCP